MTDIMPIVPSYGEIALRILLTVLAGSLIGINREPGGHAAGFRITVLVGLAACLAMVQANLILPVAGKSAQSFAVMDTLRLPLGILTGVGFIGGGAILKRGNMVSGVTTGAFGGVAALIKQMLRLFSMRHQRDHRSAEG